MKDVLQDIWLTFYESIANQGTQLFGCSLTLLANVQCTR